MTSMRSAPPAQEDQTRAIVRDAQPRPLGAVVRLLDGARAGAHVRLSAGSCVVGSAAECDLVVAEPTVSRQHVELALVPEGVTVRDLGSRNGTYYQGQRVERMTLAFGGQILLGTVRLAIEVDLESLPGELDLYDGAEYRGMLGASLAMRRLFAILSRLEGSLVTVLIEGESGVGKELVASALHEGSSVARGPWVVVNCGAIARELVASELFGHRRGSFTGAHDDRQGAFVRANGGTLFLDEVGELPLEVQPMLLRALELGEVRPVGDDRPSRVKARVLAATNRDLEGEVAAGRFRQDLFFRLAVVRLPVPPLRERAEDIPALAERFAVAAGLSVVPPEILNALGARSWPGNVRELRNVMQAYAALGTLPSAPRASEAGLEAELAQIVDVGRPYADQKDALVERFTKLYLQALLVHTRGNQTTAADISGLSRSYLGKLLVRYGLEGKAYRRG